MTRSKSQKLDFFHCSGWRTNKKGNKIKGGLAQTVNDASSSQHSTSSYLYNYERAVKAPQLSSASSRVVNSFLMIREGRRLKRRAHLVGRKRKRNFQNVSTVEKGKVYRLDTIIALPTEKTVMTPTTFLFSFFFHKINIVRLCVWWCLYTEWSSLLYTQHSKECVFDVTGIVCQNGIWRVGYTQHTSFWFVSLGGFFSL